MAETLAAAEWVKRQREARRGVPFRRFQVLAKRVGVPASRLCQVVHVKPRTLERRRKAGHFEPDESERILRLDRLMEIAEAVFEGDLDAAHAWLQRPNLALGDQKPLDAADTEPGARMVEEALHRMEHGLHS